MDYDDDETEATATLNLDKVRPTYTVDEISRMQFVLTVDQHARPARAVWTVRLDGAEIGLGFSPYRAPYLQGLVDSFLHGTEPDTTNQRINPWDWMHGENTFSHRTVAAAIQYSLDR